jgi:DNA polymerase bacteriophage-type
MAAPYDRIMVADFETLWDSKEYTLSKLTTEEYVRDERFHAYGMGYKWFGDDKAHWVSHDNLPGFYRNIDWERTAVLAHNAQFDCTILGWHYNVRPAFILDSLSMARALRGVEVGNSLAKLAAAFGLPPKGKAVHSTDGLGPVLPPEVEIELADYCKHDVWLCEQIYANLLVNAYDTGNVFPAKELRLIDMILRMFTDPKLKLDSAMLATALKEERTRRVSLLEKLGVKDEDLASTPKFADLLWHMGVETPYKESKTVKGKMIPAFAKSDVEFQALLNHDNEDIATLCEARLRVKSTLERTRAQRLLDISTRGSLPIPLAYYGAHTGRIQASKGQAINMQNLKRGSFLRKAIMAPDGHVCVVADLSQIEARVLAWLAGYEGLLGIFRSGEDVYATFGSGMFGVPGMTKESHPDLRQSAKSAVLGAGYGLGWRSFAQQLIPGFLGAPPVLYGKTFAKQLGITGEDLQRFIDWQPRKGASWLEQALAIPRNCSDEEIIVHSVCSQRIINKYRDAAKPVGNFWKLCEDAIGDALSGDGIFDYKCIQFRRGHIFLPNGMALRYPDLAYDKEKGWSYLNGVKRRKLYGGALTENIVQALARIVMTDAMLRIQKRYPVVLTVHDEIVSLAPEAEAAEAKEWVLAQMVVEPKYMQGIPLAATCDTAVRYGEAK